MWDFIREYRSELQTANGVLAINYIIVSILLLLSSIKKDRRDVLLIVVFLFTGIKFLLSVIEGTKLIRSYPHIVDTNIVLALIIPLLFYFYIIQYTDIKELNRRTIITHLIFPSIVFLAYIPFFIQPGDIKLELLTERWFDRLRTILAIVTYGLGMFYLIKSVTLLYGIRKEINQTSFTVKSGFIWVFWLYITLLVVYSISTLDLSLKLFKFKTNTFSLLIYLSHFISYCALLLLVFNRDPNPYKETLKEADPEKTKKDHDLLEGMNRLMNQEFYLDENCNLKSCAISLNTSPRHLSLLIKAHYGDSFPKYINKARIEKAKELLLKNKHYKIEAIGSEVGYKTKSVFYQNFKNHVGISPAVFKDNELKKHH